MTDSTSESVSRNVHELGADMTGTARGAKAEGKKKGEIEVVAGIRGLIHSKHKKA